MNQTVLPRIKLPNADPHRGWQSLLDTNAFGRVNIPGPFRTFLEQTVWPTVLPHQRWYAAKGKRLKQVTLREYICWSDQGSNWLLLWLDTQFTDGESQVYFVPSSLTSANLESMSSPSAVAMITNGAQTSVIYDAFADPLFCRALVQAMYRRRKLSIGNARLVFLATNALPQAGYEVSKIERLSAEGSNTVVRVSNQLFLKGYRRIREGRNPELEMGLYLTEVAPFAHVPAIAGALEWRPEDKSITTTLCVAQQYVANRGNAWSWTLAHLNRYLSTSREATRQRNLAAYLHAIKTLARRTAQLHRTLVQSTQDAAFVPEPVTQTDLLAWRDRLIHDLIKTSNSLSESSNLTGRARELADRLLAVQPKLQDQIIAHTPKKVAAVKSRYHGDYHLGQVLLLEDDFLIIDFEGEPARPFADRRRKDSALRDIAGMLRSFDYAAHSALGQIDSHQGCQWEKLRPLLKMWRTRVTQAFLDSYIVALHGCQVCPRNPDHARALIELFTLEKALYEIRYELAHRPSWAEIPLNGALSLLE